MFSYYGAKTKIVAKYPAPLYDTIVEPFAGSARYSLMYPDRNVVLYEIYEKPFRVWEYLIQATEKDILGLPDIALGEDVRTFNLSDPEKWLIGYQLQRGTARPGCIANERNRWNQDKLRIAKQVGLVKHWKIYKEDGTKHNWENATYFVDPPYTVQTHKYSFPDVDFANIAAKVQNGKGQFIVCGNADDKWLPFEPLVEMMGTKKKHIECMYYKSGVENVVSI